MKAHNAHYFSIIQYNSAVQQHNENTLGKNTGICVLHIPLCTFLIASVHNETRSIKHIHHQIQLFIESKNTFVSCLYNKVNVSYRRLFMMQYKVTSLN